MHTSEEQLRRCLGSYPDQPGAPIDVKDVRFWQRAEVGGVDVAISAQLGMTHKRPERFRVQAALALQSLAISDKVLDALERARVRALLLKGPLLSLRLYGDLALRPTADVDVLIAGEDLECAIHALEEIGGQIADLESLPYYLHHHHHVVMNLSGLPVELHFRASSSFGVVLPAEPLLARACIRDIGGRTRLILDPLDELVFLAVHAAASNMRRDVLLLDLKLLTRLREQDWHKLYRRATDWRLSRAVGTALLAANDRVGLSVSGMPRRWRRQAQLAYLSLPMRSRAPVAGSATLNWITQALLAHDLESAFRVLAHGTLRPLKRRLRRYLPKVTPEHWSG